MTPIEKQILENQVILMRGINHKYFNKHIIETEKLLNPEFKEENCCEMPEEDIMEIDCDLPSERFAPVSQDEEFVNQNKEEQDK